MEVVVKGVKKKPPELRRINFFREEREGRSVACYSITRAGSDLLFRVLRQSTIGVKGFHCRVRDGIECISFAITTGSSNAMVFRRGKE